jgi:hypothetical protein
VIGLQLQEILSEVLRYSPKSAGVLGTLLQNLKTHLSSLSIYETDTDEISSMIKDLKRFLKLFESVTSEEGLLQTLEVRIF